MKFFNNLFNYKNKVKEISVENDTMNKHSEQKECDVESSVENQEKKNYYKIFMNIDFEYKLIECVLLS